MYRRIMSASTRTIKGRIKSIGNTRKITKAMEMVSAAKMRKSIEAALNTRPFAQESWAVLRRIIGRGTTDHCMHPLLDVRVVKKLLVIVITSNRGLVGGLNSTLLRECLKNMKHPEQMMRNRVGDTWVPPSGGKADIDVITVGKKGERFISQAGFRVIASFGAMSDTPQYEEVVPIAKLAKELFVKQEYDKVVVCYNDFISAIHQKPRIRQLLPVSSIDMEKMIAQTSREGQPLLEEYEEKKVEYEAGPDYVYEPSKQEVLNYIVPKLVNMQVYQALLEASACEYSARMVAMKNASDAAHDLITDLKSSFNQVRQAGITREIAEISAGFASLE